MTLGDELTILKQDRQGRVMTSAARREELLDEFERSGLSGPRFAVLAGIKYQTFATWARKRRRQLPLPLENPQSKVCIPDAIRTKCLSLWRELLQSVVLNGKKQDGGSHE